MPAARERHDLGKSLILPGAIDAQVHSLSQKDQEDFIWSTRSAAAGGVTTIVDMPYDEGNLVCSAEAVEERSVMQARRRVSISRSTARSIPEEGPARIREMVEAGVAAFKFSTFGTDPKRFPRIPPALLDAMFCGHRADGTDGRRAQ
jgi:allantoinase